MTTSNPDDTEQWFDWLRKRLLEPDEGPKGGESSTLLLVEADVLESLQIQAPDDTETAASFVKQPQQQQDHEEFLQRTRNFSSQYEAFLDAARQNTTYDTLQLRQIESPRAVAIYSALCNLLPKLHTLDLTFTSRTPSIMTTSRIIAITAPRLQTLKIRMIHNQEDADDDADEIFLDRTAVATFKSALQSCTQLESLEWNTDTPRQLLNESLIFPKLRHLSFILNEDARIFNLEDVVARVIRRHCTTLDHLELYEMRYRSSHDLTVFKDMLVTLEKLQSLRLQFMRRSENSVWIDETSFTELAHAIAQLPNLTKSLYVGECHFPYAFFEKLGESLFLNPRRIEYLAVSLDSDVRWEDIFRAIVGAGEKSVGYLDLYPPLLETPVYGRELIGDIFTLITSPSSLEHLRLNQFPPLLDIPAVVKIIVKALTTPGARLRTLHFDFSEDYVSQQDFLDIIAAIASNKQTHLESICIPAEPDHPTRMAALDVIKNSPTLTGLLGAWETNRTHADDIIESEELQFLEALSRNYTLHDIQGFSPYRKDKYDAVLRLNKAGRKYLVEESLSVGAKIRKGVEVLIQVAENLDCLFYHLRENPSLCCCSHRHDSVLDTKPLTEPCILETAHQEGMCSGSLKRKHVG